MNRELVERNCVKKGTERKKEQNTQLDENIPVLHPKPTFCNVISAITMF